MVLKRLIPDRQIRQVFRLHASAMALLGLHLGVLGIMPVILRRGLHAGEWQTTLATMALPASSILTLFWNEIYRRANSRKFLIAVWLTNYVPLAGITYCHHAWSVLVFYVVSTFTFGAASLYNADVLRSCYPAAIRNRLFAVLNSISILCTMLSAWCVGWWLKLDGGAFRIYLPLVALLAGVGVFLLIRISRQPLFSERLVERPTQPLGTSLSRVAHSMVAVFRHDPGFLRCEAAFFVYGLGYMICYAIMPFLVCDKLKLDYEGVARSTQVAYNAVILFTLLLGGYAMDRLGPFRVTAWSFTMIIFYPLALLFVRGEGGLTLAVIYSAIIMPGIQLAQTMLPVTLARRDHDTSTYMSIHGALIGPRAILGNIAGVALYDWFDRVDIPLIIGAMLYAGGAALMARVERAHRVARQSESAAPLVEEVASEKLSSSD